MYCACHYAYGLHHFLHKEPLTICYVLYIDDILKDKYIEKLIIFPVYQFWIRKTLLIEWHDLTNLMKLWYKGYKHSCRRDIYVSYFRNFEAQKIYCPKHYLMQISRKIYVNHDLHRSLCLIYYPKSCKNTVPLCIWMKENLRAISNT